MDRGVVRGACHALRQIASTAYRIAGVREPVLLGDTQKDDLDILRAWPSRKIV